MSRKSRGNPLQKLSVVRLSCIMTTAEWVVMRLHWECRLKRQMNMTNSRIDSRKLRLVGNIWRNPNGGTKFKVSRSKVGSCVALFTSF
jgi:hypothetical protein